jgi:hypothetical protein
LKCGDIRARVRGYFNSSDLERNETCILTEVHKPVAEGNFCDECRIAHKPEITENYNWHVGFVDRGDIVTNSYPFIQRTWKCKKKLFFHLLDLRVLNG